MAVGTRVVLPEPGSAMITRLDLSATAVGSEFQMLLNGQAFLGIHGNKLPGSFTDCHADNHPMGLIYRYVVH